MTIRFQALYDFLCDRLKDYPQKRSAVDGCDDLPAAVAAFWHQIGFHPAFAPVLNAPPARDEVGFNQQRAAMLKLGVSQSLLPRCPLILADDRFSVWYLDLDGGADDPPVWGLNSDMSAAEPVSAAFSRFAIQQLATIALQNSPRLLVAPNQAFAGEKCFGDLHPALRRQGNVIVLPFDDSQGVDETRVNLCCQSVADLVAFCDWQHTAFSYFGGYLDPGHGRGKLTEIRFEGLAEAQIEANHRVTAEDGEVTVFIVSDTTRPGWITHEYYEANDPADDLLLTCDKPTAAAWIDWIESQGGTVVEVDQKAYKKQKSKKK